MPTISQLLQGVEFLRHAGPDAQVSGVEYDSRRVGPGSMFVAMQGGTSDGNRYIVSAVTQGATAIITDSSTAFDATAHDYPQIGLIEVPHGRKALAGVSANFFGHPEAQLALSGVTGTNGKTTTAFLLDAMLNYVQRTTVLVGTIEYHVANQVRSSPHTTPESRDLLELFAEGLKLGATEAVMEVSSHALEQGRVWALPHDVAIFTNLTRDHLDFHGTMEKYFAAKLSLFDGRNGAVPRVAVVNVDDPHGLRVAEVAQNARAAVYTYGIDPRGVGAGDFRASDVKMAASGMRFTMTTPFGIAALETRLTGKVNVYNLLAASAAAMARGLTLDQVTAGAAALEHVPGRFQTVDAGQPFTVVVDYAHTDDALKNLIALGREFVREQDGRVITMFGCGGDRDRTKRPLMGRVAAEGSDLVVYTSDNPRTEDPMAILEEVMAGGLPVGTPCLLDPDRSNGIHEAIYAAKPGDIVLLAGKGHEKVQVLKDRTVPFDDAEVARQVLRSLGYDGAAR